MASSVGRRNSRGMAALSKAGRCHGNDLRGVVDAVIDAWAPLGCGSEAAALRLPCSASAASPARERPAIHQCAPRRPSASASSTLNPSVARATNPAFLAKLSIARFS